LRSLPVLTGDLEIERDWFRITCARRLGKSSRGFGLDDPDLDLFAGAAFEK
jgi:hypothetical protein